MTTSSTRRRTRKSTAKKPATAATKTQTPTVLNTTVAEATKVTEATPTQPTEVSRPDITKLRGFDFVVIPLIFLEAFVVNIVQNAGFKVPDRVAVQ